jgi:hypothetical protein
MKRLAIKLTVDYARDGLVVLRAHGAGLDGNPTNVDFRFDGVSPEVVRAYHEGDELECRVPFPGLFPDLMPVYPQIPAPGDKPDTN